ncbi:MAG: GNAT family N-acetyltransferase [Nanoarchaeota archaeon]|nr:GNAT family N-acetyltransferase [Nanoarchaeota archaeon]MBU1643605.1 GNAT family N-acetyltransferase [Nanoarchaeota archaeon]MBU1976616.1 GNAT family N-acetyltransferase [Nanoarchaeota archaeon]
MLEESIKRQLRELGVAEEIDSANELLQEKVWNRLTVEQQIQAYFLIEKSQQKDEVYLQIKPYQRRHEQEVIRLRQHLVSVLADPLSDLSTIPSDSTCIVAEQKKLVLGYLLYEDEPDLRQIKEVVVEPNHRRKGVMASLISYIEGDLPLGLLVQKDNFSAQEAFLKQGFVNEGSFSSDYYLMSKTLGF